MPEEFPVDWFNAMLGMGRDWVEAALLIGLFWAALAHPDLIRSVTEFRIATLLLGIAMIVPVMIQLLLINDTRQPPLRHEAVWALYAMANPALLSSLAVALGVDSVTSRRLHRE